MSDKEIWKDIADYEGYYRISSFGRVQSLKNSRGNTLDEPKVMKLIISHKGYLEVSLSKKHVRKKHKVHRLVAQAFIPNPDNKEQINHINCNKLDNCVQNLEWVTAKENVRHAQINGLIPTAYRGESNRQAKLTDDQVEQIRTEYITRDRKYRGSALAKKYNVSSTTIYDIIYNRTYYNPTYNPPNFPQPRRKLTDEQVNSIRREYIKGSAEYGMFALAKKYNVSQAAVWNILKNKTYK